MKKTIKRITITIVTIFAFLGVSTTALAATGYITWKGSSDFQEVLETFDLISERGQELKSERDAKYRENEQLVNQLKDKDNAINANEQELDALRKENQQLRESSTNNSDELKQAEKDMKEVNQKSKDVLNSLK